MRRSVGPLVLLACVVGAGGCASERWVYDKPGVTLARLEHDLARCRKDVPPTFGWSRRSDSEIVRRCMERLGYTAAREPS